MCPHGILIRWQTLSLIPCLLPLFHSFGRRLCLSIGEKANICQRWGKARYEQDIMYNNNIYVILFNYVLNSKKNMQQRSLSPGNKHESDSKLFDGGISSCTLHRPPDKEDILNSTNRSKSEPSHCWQSSITSFSLSRCLNEVAAQNSQF